ncbi:hypothetical protein [Staphylococcus epidermidis]|uniref:hypothetical protein n=1 Tax=Staphylococcus epidermidis TaxID=1282 RepID=UPI0002DF206F|nr:hypothetical protein [Staphylococcus epidermidis]
MNAEAKFVSSVMDARLKKVKRERDSLLKQRDELINDMAETKRKASLFDEIKGLIVDTKSAEDLGECVLQLIIESEEVDHEG